MRFTRFALDKDDFNLGLEKIEMCGLGQVVALFGPNGAGKTRLLRAVQNAYSNFGMYQQGVRELHEVERALSKMEKSAERASGSETETARARMEAMRERQQATIRTWKPFVNPFELNFGREIQSTSLPICHALFLGQGTDVGTGGWTEVGCYEFRRAYDAQREIAGLDEAMVRGATIPFRFFRDFGGPPRGALPPAPPRIYRFGQHQHRPF